MNILITHEKSGVVREAFRALGHDAGMHCECRYLNGAGLHWNNRGRGWEKTEAAYRHVTECIALANASGANWYLESSVGIISTRYRPLDFSVQPYDFGEDASKRTCFWTNGLPPLIADQCKRFPGRLVTYKGKLVERWSNQTDSGQNRLGPSEKRSEDRARTYPGIAKAMAEQWGNLLT